MTSPAEVMIQRFKALKRAITVENKEVYGLDKQAIIRLNQLFEQCPELMDDDICSAMQALESGNELNFMEQAKLAPLANMSIIKQYCTLNEKSPNHSMNKEYLDTFAHAMGSVFGVKDIRNYKNRFFGVLNSKIVFKDGFSNSFVKGRATVVLPKVKDEPQIRLSADLNVAIASNLHTNQELIQRAPIQRFKFEPQQKQVVLTTGILDNTITSLVALQNACSNHNYNHSIVQKPFLKIDSTVVPSEQ